MRALTHTNKPQQQPQKDRRGGDRFPPTLRDKEERQPEESHRRFAGNEGTVLRALITQYKRLCELFMPPERDYLVRARPARMTLDNSVDEKSGPEPQRQEYVNDTPA